MKIKKKITAAVLFIFCVCFLTAVPAGAKTAYQEQWVTASNGDVYYYGKDGKKQKGMQQIDERYYYFNSKGVQRTGWQKIGSNYYFFNIASGKKGYRLKSTTVNGIRLNSTGRAKLNKIAKRKLALMVKANQTIQQITNNKMTKKQKLKKAFDYTKKHLRMWSRGGFRYSKNWDIVYAEFAFNTLYSDCYSFGAYFAYLANAIGYRATVVSSGAHGWAEIGGCVYDPEWSQYNFEDSYFAMPYRLSGVGGRQLYWTNRKYLKPI